MKMKTEILAMALLLGISAAELSRAYESFEKDYKSELKNDKKQEGRL